MEHKPGMYYVSLFHVTLFAWTNSVKLFSSSIHSAFDVQENSIFFAWEHLEKS